MASKPNDLMDLPADEAWRQEVIATEDLIESCWIAGTPTPQGWMTTWPQLQFYNHYAQVRSLVLRGFCQMIRDGNLGAGQDVAIDCGKRLVYERMMHATSDIQERVLTLIDWDYLGPKTALTPERMAVLKAVFREVMTEADWGEIATAATTQIQQQIMALTDAEAKVA